MENISVKPPARSAVRKKAAPRSQLDRGNWIESAIDVLAREGIAGLRVEVVAKRCGVTKGSFYWHFANRDALLEATLRRWEHADAEDLMAQVDRIVDPRERLVELFRRTSREMRSHVIYSALLKALDHPAVQPVMQRVSQRRIQYLAVAFRSLGLSRREAMDRGRLAYSAYVGFLQLMLQLRLQRMESAEFEGYVEHVARTLIPAPQH